MRNSEIYELLSMKERCSYARVTVNNIVIRRCGHDRWSVNDAIRQMFVYPLCSIRGASIRPTPIDGDYNIVIDIFRLVGRRKNTPLLNNGGYRRRLMKRIELDIEANSGVCRAIRMWLPKTDIDPVIFLPTNNRDSEALNHLVSDQFQLVISLFSIQNSRAKHFSYSDEWQKN